ncbi:MAG: hypothetical protein U9N77_03590, partial [Thermodesulfobacteriota bacterium]|nr:hypothetical protein [Thermodesulfobacteriota bacterium]
MNNNYMYISKSIISIILCLIFLSTFNHNIYASSEFLKTNTEIKYEELIKCIKSHNNDISKCIDHYKSYL